jgi:CubicO group peptidase (beta-lactamase class C family)
MMTKTSLAEGFPLTAVSLVAALTLIGCSDRPTSSPTTDTVDQLFAKWKQPSSPGCSLGISRNGRVEYERGYGLANLELNTPITPESVFEAASISKQFTAMSIMLLVNRGQLSLDDDVRKYLPELPVYPTPVRIRHLLNHSSGIRDAFHILELSAPEDQYGDRNDVILAQLARQRSLNYEPGTETQYNNGGYVLAAIIVKRVSGQPLAAFAKANIFTPLGMVNTRFQDDPAVIVPNRASNYYRDGGTWRFVPFGTQPGAVGNSGLWTTVGDLLRWARNLANPMVGSSRLLADMQTPQSPPSSDQVLWGLGFEIREHRGAAFVGHGGGDRGIDTYFAWYPKQQLAIAVLCNTDNIGSMQLAQRIADLYLPAPVTEPAVASASTSNRSSSPSPAPAGQPSIEQLEANAGLYRADGSESFVRVFVREGQLRLALGTGTFESFRLVPVSHARFTVGESTFAVEFTPPGRPKGLRSFAGEKQTGTFERLEPFRPSPAQLRAYAGVYASDELNVEWTIAEQGATLVIRRPGSADTVIEPLATDMFTTIGDFMKFSRDASGTTTGFTLVSHGVRSLRFERVRR